MSHSGDVGRVLCLGPQSIAACWGLAALWAGGAEECGVLLSCGLLTEAGEPRPAPPSPARSFLELGCAPRRVWEEAVLGGELGPGRRRLTRGWSLSPPPRGWPCVRASSSPKAQGVGAPLSHQAVGRWGKWGSGDFLPSETAAAPGRGRFWVLTGGPLQPASSPGSACTSTSGGTGVSTSSSPTCRPSSWSPCPGSPSGSARPQCPPGCP